MKRRIVSIATVFLVVAAVLFVGVTTQSSPGYTNMSDAPIMRSQ